MENEKLRARTGCPRPRVDGHHHYSVRVLLPDDPEKRANGILDTLDSAYPDTVVTMNITAVPKQGNILAPAQQGGQPGLLADLWLSVVFRKAITTIAEEQ